MDKNLLLKLSNKLTKKTDRITLNFPYRLQSSIGDQLRRACLSIVLNIVEGGARVSPKERKQFLNISYSSLKETKYLIYFAYDLKLIEEEFYNQTMSEINELARIMYGILYK